MMWSFLCGRDLFSATKPTFWSRRPRAQSSVVCSSGGGGSSVVNPTTLRTRSIRFWKHEVISTDRWVTSCKATRRARVACTIYARRKCRQSSCENDLRRTSRSSKHQVQVYTHTQTNMQLAHTAQSAVLHTVQLYPRTNTGRRSPPRLYTRRYPWTDQTVDDVVCVRLAHHHTFLEEATRTEGKIRQSFVGQCSRW